MELRTLGDPVLAFARAHGKKASFPEFASHANASRTQWLRNAHQYLIENQGADHRGVLLQPPADGGRQRRLPLVVVDQRRVGRLRRHRPGPDALPALSDG